MLNFSNAAFKRGETDSELVDKGKNLQRELTCSHRCGGDSMLSLFPLLLLSSLEAVSCFKRRGPEQSIGDLLLLFALFNGNTEIKVPSFC